MIRDVMPAGRSPAGVESTEALLTRVDTIASGMVDAAAPLRFGVATSTGELDAIYRLRWQVVTERGWAEPGSMPDGRETDDYDDAAVHIAAWDGTALAATCRMVLPAAGLVQPTERAFGVTLEPAGQVVDMGRQIVGRAYSSDQHVVFAALLAKTWLELRARGFDWVGGDFTPAVTRLYRLIGFRVSQIGPAKQYWGEERYPIVVDVASSVPALERFASRWLKRPA
jgi:N-acyl-L-homoserine lactone synthetase